MVHGSTHTGAALESTPDGREGWYPYFVRRGVSTYVVDQSGRGRSGFDQSVLHEAEARLVAGDAKGAAELLPAMQRITDSGAWTAWFGHLISAGSNVTRHHGASHGAHTEGARPARSRQGAHHSRGELLAADKRLDAADFDTIPYLALKGDYTATSMPCQETVDAINARRAENLGTARAEYLKLDDLGIFGVTHMMMLDANNLEIADIMLDWVRTNVAKAPRGQRE